MNYFSWLKMDTRISFYTNTEKNYPILIYNMNLKLANKKDK